MRIREGSMPPDDAYQWARVLYEMAEKLPIEELPPMLRHVPKVLVIALLLWAAPTSAQSVPGPTATAVIDSLPKPTCEGGTAEPYAMSYSASCYLPAGIAAGTPWISAVRVTITPPSGAAIVKTIPRASIVRVTSASTCAPNPAPCLQVPLGIVPAGASSARLAFVDGTGTPGPESPAVPFTPPAPSLPAPEGTVIR